MLDIVLPAQAKCALPCDDGSWLLYCYMQDQESHPWRCFTSIVKVSTSGAEELHRCPDQRSIYGIDIRSKKPAWVKSGQWEETKDWLISKTTFADCYVGKNYAVYPTSKIGMGKMIDRDNNWSSDLDAHDCSPFDFLIRSRTAGEIDQPFLDSNYVKM